MSQNRNGDQDPIPDVSVIAPVYNGCATIGDCIESLLEQGYPADCYDVIVVDNNSTDGTPDSVAKYPVTLLFECARISPIIASRCSQPSLVGTQTISSKTVPVFELVPMVGAGLDGTRDFGDGQMRIANQQ